MRDKCRWRRNWERRRQRLLEQIHRQEDIIWCWENLTLDYVTRTVLLIAKEWRPTAVTRLLIHLTMVQKACRQFPAVHFKISTLSRLTVHLVRGNRKKTNFFQFQKFEYILRKRKLGNLFNYNIITLILNYFFKLLLFKKI